MYALLLLILFPFLYKRNRTWYFIYSLLFFLVGRFFAFKLALPYAVLMHNIFYLGVLLPFLMDRSYRRYFLPAFLWIVVYVVYLYFLHKIHGNDFIRDLKDNFKVFFVFVFTVQVYENILCNKINLEYFVKAFKVIFFFEIALGCMQYFFHDFGVFFKITEYSWNGEDMSMTGTDEALLSGNLCYGTLMRASSFANFLAIGIVVLFLSKKKIGFNFSDYFLLFGGILSVLITGIRAPFLVMLLMIYFIIMKGQGLYKKILYLVLAVSAVVIFLPILSSIGSAGGLDSYDNTVLRTLNVFTMFQSGSFSEESTFTQPLSMIPYIIQHPLFGNGLHYGPGYFMALNLHVIEDVSTSDAGLFFYWAEYGIFGLLIFFFVFYLALVKIAPSYTIEKSDILFLVIMLVLQSIVDISVIDSNCTTVFALAPILLRYYSNQLNDKGYESIDRETVSTKIV